MNLVRTRVAQADHRPHDLGDARRRPAARRRSSPASTSRLASDDTVPADIREAIDRHRAADGHDAGARRAAITTEFRHGTASSTFLATPRRWPVLRRQARRRALPRTRRRPRLRRRQRRPRAAQFSAARNRAAGDRRASSPSTSGVVVSFALLCAFGLGGRGDRPQSGRGDHRRDRLLLRPLAAARTAPRRYRRLLPGPGDRLTARRNRRRRAWARSRAASSSPPGPPASSPSARC